MKSLLLSLAATLVCSTCVSAQAGGAYANYLRQVQLPSGVRWDVQVPDEGEELSPLAIDPGGARFELWTIVDAPFSAHLLDTKYVRSYTPAAEVVIVTEDPYEAHPRTRAERPFDVLIRTNGLRDDEEASDAAKAVRLMRHVQSYGEAGTRESINRDQATLLQQVFLVDNQVHHFSFPINAVPGADRAKVRGEERFSVYSLEDYQAPSSQLAAMFVQIWPVAHGSITGIAPGESLRFSTPQITLEFRDLYPHSRSYAQIYHGPPTLGTVGTVLSGSLLSYYEAVPQNKTLVLSDWDKMIDRDGQWTIELLTSTPFGIDRLAHVSFMVNRSIEVQATLTTIE